MNHRKYADAAEKLAALPVRGMHIGESPYVMLHALDRDALVDLLARLSTESETHSNGWIDQRALEIARSIAEDYGILDAQLIARIQIGVIEGIKSMISTAPEAPQAPSGEMLEAAIEQAYRAGFSQGCEWVEGAGCTEQWEAEAAYAKGYTREALPALTITLSGDFARGDLRDGLARAYVQGADDVHAEWVRAHEAGEGPPRGDPEFGEAGSGYAAAAIDPFDSRALAATPTPSSPQGEGE